MGDKRYCSDGLPTMYMTKQLHRRKTMCEMGKLRLDTGERTAKSEITASRGLSIETG